MENETEKRREDAILQGIGATRRKFVSPATDSPDWPGVPHTISVPVHRYIATASGQMCQGNGNHRCLFRENDVVEVLFPNASSIKSESENENRKRRGRKKLTVRRRWRGGGMGRVVMVVHRNFSKDDVLVQRDINMYSAMLCCREEVVVEYEVVKVGQSKIKERAWCYCISPIPGTSLWVDKRLVDHCEEGNREEGDGICCDKEEEKEEEKEVKVESENGGNDECDDDDNGESECKESADKGNMKNEIPEPELVDIHREMSPGFSCAGDEYQEFFELGYVYDDSSSYDSNGFMVC